MNSQKISLIICAYNEEKYIGNCLDFAIKNSGGVFSEIIVVNNASIDKTKEIALSYKEVRVVDENEKGLVRARQRGYLESKGDILAYIDSDTQMPEGWVDILVSEFENNSNLVCLSGPYSMYDLSSIDNFLSRLYWIFLAYPTYLLAGYMAVGGNFAIRRSILDKMLGFDTTIEFYGEDTDIARRASKFGKVKFRLGFFMNTSARRLNGEGIFGVAYAYVINYFSIVFTGRPFTKGYKDIR